MENNGGIFRINDFYQATILKTVGFPLLRLERSRGKFVTFVFDDPEHKAEGPSCKILAKRHQSSR
jgi:hypothetical protein